MIIFKPGGFFFFVIWTAGFKTDLSKNLAATSSLNCKMKSCSIFNKTCQQLLVHFYIKIIYLFKYLLTSPLMSLKHGNSVKTSEDLSLLWTILWRYSNVIFIFCFMMSSSDEYFINDMASLHCSSVRVISDWKDAFLLANGPPPASWCGALLLCDELFLCMVLSLHAKYPVPLSGS